MLLTPYPSLNAVISHARTGMSLHVTRLSAKIRVYSVDFIFKLFIALKFNLKNPVALFYDWR